MILAHLINTPGALADAVTALVVQCFDNIKHADTHPDALGAELLHNFETHSVILWSELVLDHSNRVPTCTLNSLGYFSALDVDVH